MNLKTPITYYGGKQRLLKHVLPLIPDHKTYTESFAGGLAVFFAKEPADVEVINDLNGEVINFYQVLKFSYPELKNSINETLHSKNQHDYASFIYTNPHFFKKIQRAWALWVLSKEGFAGRLDGFWGYDKVKNHKSKAIKNAIDQFLPELAERLRYTQIEKRNALQIIKSRDHLDAFHFCDPPYIDSNQGHYAGYNEQHFTELLELLSVIEGKFMLTMFPHEILSKFIAENKWRVVEINRTISASKVSRRKQIELIVMNY